MLLALHSSVMGAMEVTAVELVIFRVLQWHQEDISHQCFSQVSSNSKIHLSHERHKAVVIPRQVPMHRAVAD